MLKLNQRQSSVVMGKLSQHKICTWETEYLCCQLCKNLKNGHNFVNMHCMEKFQITDPPQVWVSSFPSVNENRISALAIMKKLKNGHNFVNKCHMEKFQITNPSKFGSPVSGISALAIMKKLTNGCNFVNMHCTEKFQITDPPPKSLGLVFQIFHCFSFPRRVRLSFNIKVWPCSKHLCAVTFLRFTRIVTYV